MIGTVASFVCKTKSVVYSGITLGLTLLVVSLWTQQVLAKTQLMTLKDGVIVYSGAGDFFRPLAVLPAKTELRSSTKPVVSKYGSFYRVLVKISDAKTVIGYVSAKADIRKVDDSLAEDDLEKYGDAALVSRAVQLSYSALRDRTSMITAGYMHYLSPGFYVKGYVGQFITPLTSATVAGGELGNDALLIGHVSGLVSYSAGLFSPSSAGTIFDGSASLNALMQASFGLRYNVSGIASLSAAATQGVFFNANNSYVTSGLTATLEVGL